MFNLTTISRTRQWCRRTSRARIPAVLEMTLILLPHLVIPNEERDLGAGLSAGLLLLSKSAISSLPYFLMVKISRFARNDTTFS